MPTYSYEHMKYLNLLLGKMAEIVKPEKKVHTVIPVAKSSNHIQDIALVSAWRPT